LAGVKSGTDLGHFIDLNNNPPERRQTMSFELKFKAGRPLIALTLSLGLLGALATGPIHAQSAYPNRAISMIVPFPPGVVDSKARVIAAKVSEFLGQPIAVENRSGAGQRLGTQLLAQAPKDGYTIGVITQAGAVMAPVLDPKLRYDALKDFQYLTLGYSSYFIFATHPKSGFTTLRQFLDRAKANPGQLKFSSSGLGTAYHVWSEALMSAAGVKLLHIPYRGAAQAEQDLAAGQVDVMLTSAGSMPRVKQGLLVAMGVSADQRLPHMQQVPTLKEQGVNFSITSWLGFAAPAGIPAAALERLNAAFKAALASPDVIKKVGADGSEVRYTTPADFTRKVEREIVLVRDINKTLKLTLD
jgi:tripartite-type tricarboxylate transporter receptor subunit TctC